VDEAENGAAVAPAEEAMIILKTVTVLRDFSDEGVSLLVVVMQMHLNVGHTQTHHFGNAIKEITPVFLLRVEKAVLRAHPFAISGSIVGNSRPPLAPPSDARERSYHRSSHAQWFIVVRHSNPSALWLCSQFVLPKAVLQVRHKPDFRMSR
jgi:hypothetical protein